MQYCIIIKGPSAVGKTVVTRKLVKRLSQHQKMAVIPGDYLAHLVEQCNFTEEQLDLKYENMLLLIGNLLRHGYNLIINDLFRRVKDLDAVVAEVKKYVNVLLIFELTAPFEVLSQRNRSRDALDYINESRLRELQEICEGIHHINEVIVDTASHNIEETVDLILEKLTAFQKA